MKIAFVSSMAPYEKAEIPLGIAYLSAMAKRHVPNARVIWVRGTSEAAMRGEIEEFAPDLIGFSAPTVDVGFLAGIGRALRVSLPTVPQIWGGYHVSIIPHDLPPEANAGVIGEGEITLTEILDALGEFPTLPADCLSGINGLVFRCADGRLIQTPARGNIHDLDELPMPDWGLFPPDVQPAIMSSRGCMFTCGFCSSTAFWGRSLRKHSPGRILAEIEEVMRIFGNPHLVKFNDDTLADDVRRLEQLADLVTERSVKLPKIWGHARAALITPRMVSTLKRLNIYGLSFGFESGSNDVLKNLKSGAASMGLNVRAALLCQRSDIVAHGHIIIGSPTETAADAIQSLNMLYLMPVGAICINTASPLPGTSFSEFAKNINGVEFSLDEYRTIWGEHMKPSLAFGMSLEDFIGLKKQFLAESRNEIGLHGTIRRHALVGMPWTGDPETMRKALTNLYSTDYQMAVHVALFGVPHKDAAAIHRSFPVIVPDVPAEEAPAMAWLAANTATNIPIAWLTDDFTVAPLPSERLLGRLSSGAGTDNPNWVKWRWNLETIDGVRTPETL